LVAGSILLLAGLAWAWTMTGAGLAGGDGMAGMGRADPPGFGLVLAMWWVMMAAMMLPSAAPAILLYGRVRAAHRDDPAIAGSWIFMAGYLLAWLAVAAAATALQSVATRAGLLDAAAMRLTSPLLAGATFLAAGLYQLSPAKHSCLARCRSPASFLSRHWRAGAAGALRLGLLHGVYCIGCCWLLMALLFVGGVMNLLWIVALSALVAVERLVKRGALIGKGAGVALILWGTARIAGL
jgi:predicted metal-binding membrane protein